MTSSANIKKRKEELSLDAVTWVQAVDMK